MRVRRVPLEWEMRVPHLNSLHRAKWDWASENLTSVDLGYVWCFEASLKWLGCEGFVVHPFVQKVQTEALDTLLLL